VSILPSITGQTNYNGSHSTHCSGRTILLPPPKGLTRDAGDDAAVADEMDRIAPLMVSAAACTLGDIRLKASICRDIACGEAELAWPMLSSLMAFSQQVSLDQATLRSIFAGTGGTRANLPPAV
jgi:hypothetical protein